MKEQLKKSVAVIDGHTHVGISPKFYLQQGYPYAMSLEDLLIRMETLDIDYSVVFPFVSSAYYDDVPTGEKRCKFPYEAENANLLNEINEIFPHSTNKTMPFLMFDPSHETEKQADYLRTLAQKYPVYGLKTVTTYIQAFVKDMESKGKPILDFARESKLPFVFHSAVHPDDPWASVYDIIGFAERTPDIRVCIAHTARFTKPVLEKAARLNNCYVDLSAFIIHCQLAQQNSPAVASQDIRFPADYDNPRAVMMSIIDEYPDTILWGSDTPFYYWIQKYHSADGTLIEEDLRCGYKEEKELIDSLPAEMKKRISYENTLRFIFGEDE